MKIKILFINPSLRLGSATKYLPVGIASVMTYVHRSGYKFDLLDIDINDYADDYVEKFISTNAYDVVLSGSIVTHYKWMKWLCQTIRGYHPKTKIIIGNSVAGSVPELFLRNSAADVAVIGEGELTCLEVLNSIRDGTPLDQVKGIGFLDESGAYVQTERRSGIKKIDDFPMVEWDFFDVEAYFRRSYASAEGLIFDEGSTPRAMPVVSARGCVFRCSFCHFVFWDDPYRYRSPESILEEIERNIKKYNANYFAFWDDLSFASLPQVERMVDAILSSGLQFNWNCAVRTDLFGNLKHEYSRRLEVAKKMRSSGCINVGFSLESGNHEILEMMNKRVKPEYFKEQIKVLNEAGISSSVSVVFGYPIETEETIAETFQQCLDVGIYPSIGYLLPLPYTGMYDYAKTHGFITDEDAYLDAITERQDFCLNMTSMPQETIESLVKHYATQLNDQLKLGLENGQLLKTGGYVYTKTETAANPRPRVDPDKLERTKNDFSFNYSQVVFHIGNSKTRS